MVTEVTNRIPIPASVPSRSQSLPRSTPESVVAAAQVRQDAAVQGQTVSEVSSIQGAQKPSGSTTPVSEAVSHINNYVQNISRKLEFSVDDKTDRVVVKVLDSETEEIIREIPSKEALALARFVSELQEAEVPQSEGLIIRAKA